MTAITSLRRKNDGQSAVEFALLVPVFLLIIGTIIQFGGLYNHYESLTDATRAGARKAVVSRTSSNPVSAATQAVKDSAPNLDWTKAGASISVSPSPPWTSGQQVTVSATYPYSITLIGLAVTAGNLTSTTKERVE